MLLHEREGLRGDLKSQLRIACREARHAQDAHRVFDETCRHVAQHTRAEVRLPAIGIDELAVRALGHRVDGEIAPLQVLLQRDIG